MCDAGWIAPVSTRRRFNFPGPEQHLDSRSKQDLTQVGGRGLPPRGHESRKPRPPTGRFNITTRTGLIQGINHKHLRLLQRADGYGYTTQKETTVEQ
jgi:hypothetical protein